jgi:parallel beta-helix repeat protein
MATGKTRAALFYVIIIFLVGAAASLLSMPVYAQTPVTPPANASINEVTVRPASLNGWRFTLEAPVASGEFVSGPAQAPLGSGSLQLSTSGQGAYALSTPAYAGLRLNALSHLAYATYRSSFDPDEHTTVNLQFDIDYNVEDENPAPQGRLVFEPYMTNRPVGGVEQNIWQAWDALATNSAWWATAQPGARYCTQPSPCTWQQILALFPNAAIAAENGQVRLHAGSPWQRPVVASADALVIGVAGVQTRYDFEPETPCIETCYVDGVLGNDAFGGDTPASAKRTIQAALAQAAPGGEVVVAAGTYTETLTLTRPVTLAGPNREVCPHDPTAISQPNPARVNEAVLAPVGGVAFTLVNGVDDVTVAGFTVAAPAVGGVVTDGADLEFARIAIRNNRFAQLAGVAVASGAGQRTNWEITCNRSEGAGATAIALTAGESRQLTVTENYLRGEETSDEISAIVLENSIDAIVQGNMITDFGGDAIRLVNRARRSFVGSNTLVNVGIGVHLQAVANTTTEWLEQVYIESNAITDVTTAAVLVEHTGDEAAGGAIADLCICANTIAQDAGLLVDSAALIDLRLRETTEDPNARIVVQGTDLELRGDSVAAVYGLRVRGALQQLDVYGNEFDGGGVGDDDATGQPPSSGVYLQTDDAVYGSLPPSAQMTLTSTEITGFAHGVTIFDPLRGAYGGLPDGASVQVSDNRIAGNRYFGARNGEGAELVAVNNWWGDAQGPGGVGPGAGDAISENIVYCTWLDAPPPLGVATGFVHNLATGRDFCTINSAVADASTQDGHTLLADARVFVEQVTVSKSVTLTGSVAGVSVIRAPATLSPENGGAIVAVTGAGVVAQVSNFTVEGPGDGVCGTLRAGIAVQGGAQAVIHDNTIRAIRNEPLQACAHGVGIAVGNHSLASPGLATIANNRISGYQKAGVVVSGVGAHAALTSNQIEGAGPTSVLVQNGVQVSYGATATITGNTITGHAFTPFSLVSTGILLYQADADADGNTLRDNQVGIYLVDSSGVHERNTISATTTALASPSYWGVIVDAPPPGRKPQLALGMPHRRAAAEVRGVQHVIVRNNALISDGGGVGLQADGGYGALDIDLTATNNEIRGWGRGVNITQCAGSCTGASYQAATIRHNLIAGNGAAFDNSSAGGFGVQAAENWWGTSSGPTTPRNPGGGGGALAGDADFAPWLCNGADTDPLIGFQPEDIALCGLAEQLVILTQPVGGLEGFPLPQQPVVRVQDRDGNLAVNFNGPVTIAPAPGSSAVVGGGVTVYAVNGIAQFTDVRVNSYGEGLVLTIGAPGLASVASFPIAVAPQTGDITVRVEVVGQLPAEKWRVDGPTGSTTLQPNGGELTLTDLHANETYTIALENKPGYTLAANCVAGASGSDRVAVPLDYQAHVTCTFVATAQPATVTIHQTVSGQTPVIDWEFTGDFGAFALPAAGGERQFSTPAGVYLVQSAARVSYSPAVACTDGAGGGHQALLVLAPGERVRCTFTATERTTALVLSKTVGLTPDRCGVSNIVGVPAGTTIYYCYTILNTGAAPLSLHNLADSEIGPVLIDLDYVLAPGATIDTVALGRVLSESVAATTVTDGVWTAATGEGPAAHDQATAAVNVLRASVSSALTAGGAGVTCGEHSELKVEQGNKVNYCVTLFNGGEVVLQTHRIVIPGLNIDQQFDHLLAPGAFVRVTAADIPLLGGVTIAATQTQTLTVYSTNPPANPIDAPQYLVAPELFTAESSAEAVVQLLENGVEPEAQTWLYLPNIAR